MASSDKQVAWTQAQVQRLARSLVTIARNAGLPISGVEAHVSQDGLRVRVLTQEGAAENAHEAGDSQDVTEADMEALQERLRRLHGKGKGNKGG